MSDYDDLGTHSFSISTNSPDGQLWFDRGLIHCYAFNHEEAVRCFRRALDVDPDCAMSHWGIAYALGPNYNKAWEAFEEEELTAALGDAHTATASALALSQGGPELERALIAALPHRYPSAEPGEDTAAWIEDFASAMRDVYQRFPDHADVAALFAEALMNRTPWALWDLKTGMVAEGASTEEAAKVLETAMARIEAAGGPSHPGLLHFYIHLMEMSPHPERALKAADQLRDLVPDAGHLQHMPTHIGVLCGHYQTVVTSNEAAIVADRKFLAREGALNFFSLYRCHNYHFKVYGAMFLGQYGPAIDAAEEMNATLPAELLTVQSPPMADWLEGFVPIKQHVLIRFGKWDEIIAQDLPEDPDLFCVTTAMMHYAKAVAHASRGDVPAAEAEATLFDAALSRVPDTRYLFNNSCPDILAIEREMMLGEIEEAAAVYRADLGYDDTLSRACQHPDNVWSLHGYHECLVRLGRADEATMIKQRLDLANARTDVPVKASCFCRLEALQATG